MYRQAALGLGDLRGADLRLPRLAAALSRMEDEEPKLAIAFHCFVVRTLADRLVGSDRTIAALSAKRGDPLSRLAAVSGCEQRPKSALSSATQGQAHDQQAQAEQRGRRSGAVRTTAQRTAQVSGVL